VLILTRGRNEQLVISVPGYEPIVVCVVDIRGDKVRLGVDANKEIPVHRLEVFRAIHNQTHPAPYPKAA
jgi:carbon storage regulator